MDLLKGLFKEFGWFIYLLIGIGLLWFFTGGYLNHTAYEGPYIKPLAPLDTGRGYGGGYTNPLIRKKAVLDLPASPTEIIRNVENNVSQKIHDTLLVSKQIIFEDIGGVKETDPQKEYIHFITSNVLKQNLNISNLSIRGEGYTVTMKIPKATELPILSKVYETKDIFVPANSTIFVSTGRSPIGTSFRVNMCSGYLSQFQTYTPKLTEECPQPVEALENAGLGQDISCRTFVQTLPSCRVYTGTLPSQLSTSCKNFVTNNLTYNSCVSTNSKESGFYKNEWRVFLEQKQELWKKTREIIRIFDASGNTIDAITY